MFYSNIKDKVILLVSCSRVLRGILSLFIKPPSLRHIRNSLLTANFQKSLLYDVKPQRLLAPLLDELQQVAIFRADFPL